MLFPNTRVAFSHDLGRFFPKTRVVFSDTRVAFPDARVGFFSNQGRDFLGASVLLFLVLYKAKSHLH